MASPSNIVASLQSRLKNEARSRGENVQTLLEEFALGRFFARLAVSEYSDRLILKGAQLFRIWSKETHRPTRDADFLGFGEPEPSAVATIFDQICATKVEEDDGLEFGPANADPIRDENAYGGIRVKITAKLGNIRTPLQFDVGYGDAITPATEQRSWPGLLGFPDTLLITYPMETAIAEKLEAMVSLGLANSRMKDFYDLHWLATHFDLNQASLKAAIKNTFARRQSPLPTASPVAYTPEFYVDSQKVMQWNAFLRKNKLQAPKLPQLIKTIQDHFPFPV